MEDNLDIHLKEKIDMKLKMEAPPIIEPIILTQQIDNQPIDNEQAKLNEKQMEIESPIQNNIKNSSDNRAKDKFSQKSNNENLNELSGPIEEDLNFHSNQNENSNSNALIEIFQQKIHLDIESDHTTQPINLGHLPYKDKNQNPFYISEEKTFESEKENTYPRSFSIFVAGRRKHRFSRFVEFSTKRIIKKPTISMLIKQKQKYQLEKNEKKLFVSQVDNSNNPDNHDDGESRDRAVIVNSMSSFLFKENKQNIDNINTSVVLFDKMADISYIREHLLEKRKDLCNLEGFNSFFPEKSKISELLTGNEEVKENIFLSDNENEMDFAYHDHDFAYYDHSQNGILNNESGMKNNFENDKRECSELKMNSTTKTFKKQNKYASSTQLNVLVKRISETAENINKTNENNNKKNQYLQKPDQNFRKFDTNFQTFEKTLPNEIKIKENERKEVEIINFKSFLTSENSNLASFLKISAQFQKLIEEKFEEQKKIVEQQNFGKRYSMVEDLKLFLIICQHNENYQKGISPNQIEKKL